MKNQVVSTEISEELMAQSLSQQYADIHASTCSLVQKVIVFGCALAQAETVLEAQGKLVRSAGCGLFDWLAKNCPNVNYKTAMRWKSIAVKISDSLSATPSDALSILSGDKAVSKTSLVAQRRDQILSAENVRQLSSVLFDFTHDAPDGSASPDAEKKPQKLTRMESARRLWAGILCNLSRNREGLYKSVTLLPIDEARAALAEVKALVAPLEKRVKEGR